MAKTVSGHPDRRCTNGLEAREEGTGSRSRGVKEKWGQSADDDLDVIGGRRDRLEGKIQQRCGLAKDQVGKDIDDCYAVQRW
jgi:uncharacterized protein YjbJ (UPF0337 family)